MISRCHTPDRHLAVLDRGDDYDEYVHRRNVIWRNPCSGAPWDAQMYSAVVGDVLFVSQELETLSRWCPWSWIPHPGTQFRTTILGLKMSYPRSVGPRSVMGWIGVTDSADVFTNVIPYPAIPVAMAPCGYGMQLRYRWRRTAEIL